MIIIFVFSDLENPENEFEIKILFLKDIINSTIFILYY